jgi:predicted PhzF superfamily epimerase YddE/YHI9
VAVACQFVLHRGLKYDWLTRKALPYRLFKSFTGGRSMAAGLPLFQVDAFASEPFTGNPAAVCLLPGPRDDGWMQQVAGEMNLSVTAFLHSTGDGNHLRWFTPAVELDLCGFATLASAHVLWEQGRLKPAEQACFHTKSGMLTAKKSGAWIELDFPAEPARITSSPPGLNAALGTATRYVGRNRFDYLIEVDSEETLRELKPDFQRLANFNVRGIIVTAKASTPGYDFVSRFFAPETGVLEDPVTGSAHCCLAPFWRDRLKKDEMTAYQASARGGVVGVRVEGQRVFLRGQAVTTLRGELLS